mmetsp:Transcript_20753/g.26453  ORF Transcript_20753/g.26453 Transcript_20753/m.26453 type:complete len:93 (+) Transcript_20753:1869-2147(+)
MPRFSFIRLFGTSEKILESGFWLRCLFLFTPQVEVFNRFRYLETFGCVRMLLRVKDRTNKDFELVHLESATYACPYSKTLSKSTRTHDSSIP